MNRFLFVLVHIRPICLPVNEPIRSRDYVGYNPLVAGWILQEDGKSSNILHEWQYPILPNYKCKEESREQGKLISEAQFGNSVICVGYLVGHDNHQGDSGGKNHIF